MPQLQNLVLKDRTPVTPVDHTFVPRDITNNVGTVAESTGVPIGDKRFTISLNRTAGGKYKAVVQLTVPIVQNQTVSGVVSPVIVRTAYAKIDFTFDQSSTEQERNDIVGMLADSLTVGKTLVNDTVVKLQGVY